MPPKEKKPDLTPEERLFRLIQEGEKAEEKEDTLISSGSGASAMPRRPEKTPTEDAGNVLSEKESRKKIAVRAGGGHTAKKRPLFVLRGIVGRILSLQVLNRVLAACLFLLLFYFVTSHGLARESPNTDFMLKANASITPPIEVPSNLFSVNVPKDAIPERNVFQPYRTPEPKAAEVVKPEPISKFQVLQQFKLSGIYMDDEPEALVEVKDEKRTYTVKGGTELKGLTVKQVMAEGVLFSDGKAEQMLR